MLATACKSSEQPLAIGALEGCHQSLKRRMESMTACSVQGCTSFDHSAIQFSTDDARTMADDTERLAPDLQCKYCGLAIVPEQESVLTTICSQDCCGASNWHVECVL